MNIQSIAKIQCTNGGPGEREYTLVYVCVQQGPTSSWQRASSWPSNAFCLSSSRARVCTSVNTSLVSLSRKTTCSQRAWEALGEYNTHVHNKWYAYTYNTDLHNYLHTYNTDLEILRGASFQDYESHQSRGCYSDSDLYIMFRLIHNKYRTTSNRSTSRIVARVRLFKRM